jgi:hypothetical protein
MRPQARGRAGKLQWNRDAITASTPAPPPQDHARQAAELIGLCIRTREVSNAPEFVAWRRALVAAIAAGGAT